MDGKGQGACAMQAAAEPPENLGSAGGCSGEPGDFAGMRSAVSEPPALGADTQILQHGKHMLSLCLHSKPRRPIPAYPDTLILP